MRAPIASQSEARRELRVGQMAVNALCRVVFTVEIEIVLQLGPQDQPLHEAHLAVGAESPCTTADPLLGITHRAATHVITKP
jgi:hypothetical protein